MEDIDPDRMKNVRVEVGYGHSSSLGRDSVYNSVIAEVRRDESSPWEEVRSDGVAFSLEDLIQKK
jgi:hypothetical protein